VDLKALRYFVAAVEAGSISAAAARCFVAQPSITMAIAKLEEELGAQLFERHRRGVTPTNDGRSLFAMAKDLLNHAASIKHSFVTDEQRKTLRFAVDKTVRIAAFDTLLDQNEAWSNNFELELVSDKTDADAILTSKDNYPEHMEFLPLIDENYALLMPLNHALAYRSDLAMGDLNGQRIIERVHCQHQALLNQALVEHDVSMTSVAKVETEEWAHALVANGVGLTFAPVPNGYEDPRFHVRDLHTCFGIQAPTRVVGLAMSHAYSGLIRETLAR